jgi:hypothetical protein
MRVICASVVSSGGSKPPVELHAATMDASYTTTSATAVPIFAISMKEKLGGLANRAVAIDFMFEASLNTAPAQFLIYNGGTVTGPTWISAGSLSAVSYATSITSCSGGQLVQAINILPATGSANVAKFGDASASLTGFSLTRNALNTGSDTICVTVKRLSNTNAVVMFDASWGEVR